MKTMLKIAIESCENHINPVLLQLCVAVSGWKCWKGPKGDKGIYHPFWTNAIIDRLNHIPEDYLGVERGTYFARGPIESA